MALPQATDLAPNTLSGSSNIFIHGELALPCVGDCDASATVTVDELIRGVNIALGTAGVDECVAFDLNDDSQVTIEELVAAVDRALNGCG